MMLDTTTGSDESTERRQSVWAKVSVVLSALALFVAGVGIGWLFTGDAPEPVSTATEIPASAASSSTTTTTLAPLPQTAPPPSPGVLDGQASDEPIADVAEALLPSIVQIELEFGGVGSGVIYSPDGRILTAAHVVQGNSEVEVRLWNGEKATGRVLGADAGNDIAVVEVDRDGLPAAPLALEAKPRVGQMAIALGSPWGLDSTVTAGIVSAVDRPIRDGQGVRAMLQTDAPINPGNSGGALADRHGRVIGINVSIFSSSGANDGVGFAVPIDRAYAIAEALVSGGRFVPGFLGVSIDEPAGGQRGALVTEVFAGSAAEAAGIRPGDIVIAVNGVDIADVNDLGAQIRTYQAGEMVTVDVLRDGVSQEVEAVLGTAD